MIPDAAQPIVALLLLALLFVAFVSERYPPDVTAAAGAAVFIMLGLTPTGDVMDVFSNSAPITIAAMFVVSGALVRTGLLDALATAVISRAQTRPKTAIAAFLSATVVISAFVNNTPVVLVLIPVVIRLARSLDLAPTKLLIPLSYAAILGGTCTLIGTSTNLLVDGLAQKGGLPAFSIFEITGVGLVTAITGVLVMLVLGPRLLPDRDADGEGADGPAEHRFLSEVAVEAGFDGIGKPLAEAAPFQPRGVRILGLRRRRALRRENVGQEPLEAGDIVVIEASTSELLTLEGKPDLRVGLRRGSPREDETAITAEAILTPRSTVPRPRVSELAIGPQGGIRVLGVHRHLHTAGPDLLTARLRMGDRLLLRAAAPDLDRMADAGDLLAITRPGGRAYRRGHAPLALAGLLAVVGLAAFDVAPIGILALVAVAGLLVARCIDNDEAWASIDGGILILIFAMLIIGAGLDATGAVAFAVQGLTPILEALPPFAMLLVLYLAASALTEVVTNNAVAVVLTPLVIGLADALGHDPRGLVVAVMFAASASFATPIGYQTNTLVYRAGNYNFADFIRVGLPMNIIVGIATCGAIAWLFPL